MKIVELLKRWLKRAPKTSEVDDLMGLVQSTLDDDKSTHITGYSLGQGWQSEQHSKIGHTRLQRFLNVIAQQREVNMEEWLETAFAYTAGAEKTADSIHCTGFTTPHTP